MAKRLSPANTVKTENTKSNCFTNFQRFADTRTIDGLTVYFGAHLLEMRVSCAASYSSKQEIDEGLRLGDYPVLPWRSAQEERPTGWWDDQDRRDKETPVSWR